MKKKLRRTKDIKLATAWMALGAKYESVDRTDRAHQVFTFSSEEDAVDLDENKQVAVTRGVDMDLIERQLANRELLVNAADLLDSFQRMKALIHSS